MPRPPDAPRPWAGVRLHVVTGKGGTGKTTVAGALALALATPGRRVLLIEVEGRQGLAQLFDTPPLPYAELHLAAAPGGGEVYGLAVDAEEALLDYLELFYNLRRAGAALRRIGAIDFATTVAPGMRDVLLTGKAKEAVRRKKEGRPAYDAVVMDAPPTGRITRFLNVNQEVAGLARGGPIRKQADDVMAVVASPLTAVHLVTLLEPMPVQETCDGVSELRAAGLPLGAVFVNMVREPLLAPPDLRKAAAGRLGRDRLAADLERVGVLGPDGILAGIPRRAVLDPLCREAADHAARVALEAAERTHLEALGLPCVDLPWLADGVEVGALYQLAAVLRKRGGA